MPTHFVYRSQGQYVAVVLAALDELRGENTKLKTIGYIEKMGWLDLQPEDWTPYPTHQYEARWHTKIAFARQWCVDSGLVSSTKERDAWKITTLGIERLAGVREKFKNGVYDAKRGFLWSPVFKKWLSPSYQPSEADLKRPSTDEYEFV